MSQDLTIEQLHQALPKGLRKSATQELVDKVNTITTDPIVREAYRDNLLSYTSVMNDGRFKITQYIDAVRYITHKLMGNTNIEAYRKTFPDRYTNFIQNGTNAKDIASYVTSYNKNKLVNLVRDQSLIPTHILNADLYQKAINTQAEIMADPDVNSRDRTAAANSLLQHLKAPDSTKIELDVSVKTDNVISDLRKTTLDLVAQQKKMLEAGVVDAKEIAESNLSIIESEVDD